MRKGDLIREAYGVRPACRRFSPTIMIFATCRRKPPPLAKPCKIGTPALWRLIIPLIFTARSWLDRLMPKTSPSGEAAPKALLKGPRRRTSVSVRKVSSHEAQPFLKWAGGKGQLLQQFQPFFPKTLHSYFEPFLGGGAVFFHLKARVPKMRATLRDINPELINCYQVVRDAVEALMARLDEHLRQYQAEGEPYFYRVREGDKLSQTVERAARMIFLNKTCFNGLWRVNARGRFNVPVGSYRPDRVSLYDRAKLMAASLALQGVDLKVQDFRKTLAEAGSDDFVYVDPPYYPLSRTANFTSYTQDMFGHAEQKELAEAFAAAAKRGARLMLSNSDTPTTRELYNGFNLHTVQARRAVNCDGTKRGLVSELVVLTYVPK
jgi:DNA adenine methylase